MEEFFDVLNERGEFTGEIKTREECHRKGLWHRCVYGFIIDKDKRVLLQKRSINKKVWPGKWDITVGGHVSSGEWGIEALIRECKEEIGVTITDDEIKYITCATSIYKDIINGEEYFDKHYIEYFLITKEVSFKDIQIGIDEVEEAKFFTKEDIIDRINDGYREITEKVEGWNILEMLLLDTFSNKKDKEGEIFNKLVRDNIPAIIEKSGKIAIIKKLNEEEYKKALESKLKEECLEFIDTQRGERMEELADILEVINSLAELEDTTLEEVIQIAKRKVELRGGFKKRLFLEKILKDRNSKQ